jgi:hypothetical protein
MMRRFGAQPLHNAGFFMRLMRRPVTRQQPLCDCGKMWTSAIWLLCAVGASGCQEPGQPGAMERTGAEVDRTMGQAQQGVGDFSLRVGRALNQAGQSVGNAANVAGTGVHDWLTPAEKADQASGIDPSSSEHNK